MKLVPFPKFLHKSLVCPLHVCLGTACCHERSSLLGSHIEYICRNCHFLNNFSLIGNDSTISCNKINIIFYRCKHSFNTVIFSAADSRKYNSLSLQLSDNIINFRINIHGAFFQKCTIQIWCDQFYHSITSRILIKIHLLPHRGFQHIFYSIKKSTELPTFICQKSCGLLYYERNTLSRVC